MDCHERDTTLLVALAVKVAHQCYILQIVSKIHLIGTVFLTGYLDKVMHTTDKLLQVLLTSYVVGVV